ncbi:MAG: SUMF1/EgtB/PvdO family nonheme iron enzyme, partial [Chloroflexi bacterium]|nr:SUMF1/EgtB/PvdO family nonheme iron enzyme [Chloroflexota bacterium]
MSVRSTSIVAILLVLGLVAGCEGATPTPIPSCVSAVPGPDVATVVPSPAPSTATSTAVPPTATATPIPSGASVTPVPVESITSDMVLVEPGSFQMGSTEGLEDQKPVHTVHITRPFYISKYEVTQEQYRRFCVDTPGAKRPQDLGWGNGPQHSLPVVWYDAVKFCNWLSEQEGLTPCYSGKGRFTECDFSANGYRLPTEAEWEYAARGGHLSQGFEYAGSDDVDRVAWYNGNSAAQIQPVGQKQPNELGLYDMSGNAWEWCGDWYSDTYYASSPASDPRGPLSGTERVRRG